MSIQSAMAVVFVAVGEVSVCDAKRRNCATMENTIHSCAFGMEVIASSPTKSILLLDGPVTPQSSPPTCTKYQASSPATSTTSTLKTTAPNPELAVATKTAGYFGGLDDLADSLVD